ncbi:MAG TPA: hypothetical protein VHY20_09280, partial [Pirellulales bacterium]|nr:hypothetical protein [Pirellulales bacterium]
MLSALVAVAVLGERRALAADVGAIQTLYRTGQYAAAAAEATKLLADGESDEAIFLVKLRAELAVGDYEAALATWETATQQYLASLALRLAGREVLLVNKQSDRAVAQLDMIQSFVRQFPWRYGDPANCVLLGRALLLTGVEPRQVLERLYDKARRESPDLPDVSIAIAELALDKHDDALAAETLVKALKFAPDNPEIHYLLARALAAGDAKRASAALAAALAINPRHLPSLLLQVDDSLDREDQARAAELLDQIAEINAREPLAWAYRAVLAHLAGDSAAEEAHRARALVDWPTNPRVDHLIGRQLSRHYRFAEGAAAERRALELAPEFVPAKIALAQDLLRLGQEDEGWQLADEAYNRDGYNVVAHNLTALHEALAKYQTLTAEGLLVRMDAREAEIYGPRVLRLLGEARDALSKKYQVELPDQVIVEIFADQKDFAIRTFGLPGGAGFLGVCFGRVVTANSPASQADHAANWQAVLWHEFCHVVTLVKTHNKMPRWLSEGISVYEERQRDPAWGQSMTPEYRRLILSDALTSVSRLSGAFLKPPSPQHLQFAYFESSLVVEYLVGRYGPGALDHVLNDLADDVPINTTLARHTEKIEQLDADFQAY